MHVSTARVLRKFAQKFAAASELDKLQNAQLETASPAKPYGPEDAPRTGFAGKSTDPYVSAIENATRKPSVLHSALSGVDSAVDAGKSLYNNATPTQVGLGLGGAALGGGALYALARALQTEEQRKKKTPVVMPALGAAAGGVALPALIAALSGGKAPEGDLKLVDGTAHLPPRA